MRGSVAERICPNVPLVKFTIGLPRFTRFRTLKRCCRCLPVWAYEKEVFCMAEKLVPADQAQQIRIIVRPEFEIGRPGHAVPAWAGCNGLQIFQPACSDDMVGAAFAELP